jgi:ParB/RepB/Spo0J family partition protein
MAVAQVESQIQNIPIEKIDVHRLNPRADVGDIAGLVESIGDDGLYQPILVVKDNGGWALVDGKRRLAAAKKLGLVTIPAIERVMTLSDIATAALVANLQRKDLDALEEARGYRAWIQATDGGSQADLARLLGKDPSTISNALRLLDAPKPIADALREKRITPAHARVALELKDPAAATALPLKAGVTVDQLQESVTRQNEDYDTKGAGARAVLRQALADAKAKYPNATITWQSGGAYGSVVSLTATLGRPPAKIVAGLQSFAQVTAMAHDKACTCRAYQLSARRAYSGQSKLITELERVCIDKKGYAAAKPKARAGAKTSKAKAVKKPKAPTPEQLKKIEAKQHQEAQREVAKALELPKARSATSAPLFKRLSVTSIPHEIARAIVITEALLGGGVRETSEMLLWQRIKEMPAKKISQLAGATVAHLIEQETSYSSRSEGISREALIYFGVKVPTIKTVKKARR